MRHSALLLVLLAVSGCAYNVVGTPTYEDAGVQLLYAPPVGQPVRSLGLRSWGFYRPGITKPSLTEVWEMVAAKVRAEGGNACLLKYQKQGEFFERTVEVTCEVLQVQ